jgi:hypothetical protein
MKTAGRLLVFGSLFLALSQIAFAAHDWTAVASTGAIDNSSLGFFAFAGPTLTYLAGSNSAAPVIARYNVTNTYDEGAIPDMPGRTTLELGYSAIGLPPGAVSATLFQVDPCTGNQVAICTVNSLPNATNICGTCNFGAGVFNFANHLYYIQVTLTRPLPPPNLFPTAKTLRLF